MMEQNFAVNVAIALERAAIGSVNITVADAAYATRKR